MIVCRAHGNREAESEPQQLEALAGFLPVFEDAAFVAGEVVSPQRLEASAITPPFVVESATVEQFVQAAYAHHWVLADFNWPEWAASREAASLRDSEPVLAGATPQQLAMLLTVAIRQDRFVEGAFLDALESGLILRVVRRAAAIVRQRQGPSPEAAG